MTLRSFAAAVTVLTFTAAAPADSLKFNNNASKIEFVGKKKDGSHKGGFKKFAGTIDAHAFDAGRARHGGEIRIVALAGLGMMEVSRKLAAAEVAALEAADRRIGVIVPHHPDDRDVVFDRGAEHARMHEEGAVAAH